MTASTSRHIKVPTTRLPSVLPTYLRIILGSKKGVDSASQLPNITTSWHDACFDRQHIEKFREVCVLPVPEDDMEIPMLYPHAFLGPLHLKLMTHDAFPLPILGSVHLRNHITQHFPLRADKPFDVQLVLKGGRRRPQGWEIDLSTLIRVDGKCAWESLTTILVRVRTKESSEVDAESPLAKAVGRIVGAAQRAGSFPIPSHVGRSYGWLTKDLNPIHTSPLAAKLFGFERDLAHGMWGVARALPLLSHGIDMNTPVRLDCAFKGPMYMGSGVSVVRSGSAFEMYSGDNPKPSVIGRITNLSVTPCPDETQRAKL